MVLRLVEERHSLEEGASLDNSGPRLRFSRAAACAFLNLSLASISARFAVTSPFLRAAGLAALQYADQV